MNGSMKVRGLRPRIFRGVSARVLAPSNESLQRSVEPHRRQQRSTKPVALSSTAKTCWPTSTVTARAPATPAGAESIPLRRRQPPSNCTNPLPSPSVFGVSYRQHYFSRAVAGVTPWTGSVHEDQTLADCSFVARLGVIRQCPDRDAASRLPPTADYSGFGPLRTDSENNTGPDGTYTIVRPETLGKDSFLHAPIIFGPGIGGSVESMMNLLQRIPSLTAS